MRNCYEVDGDRVIIKVLDYKTQEFRLCFIDLADLPIVSAIVGTWYANHVRGKQMKWYAQAKAWNKEAQTSRTVIMHRLILGLTDPDIEADHRDNDGLNNQRRNLRPCSHLENMRFRQPNRDWAAYDEAEMALTDRRGERIMAKAIEKRFRISRGAMWFIRIGKTTTSPAAIAYREACALNGRADRIELFPKLQDRAA